MFPSCVSATIEIFNCVTIEGTSYVVTDYRYICYDQQWSSFVWFACLGIMVYPIGIPAMFAMVLRRNAHKLNSDQKLKNRYGFLYERYIANFYYWETVDLMRKSSLTIAVTFVAPRSEKGYSS